MLFKPNQWIYLKMYCGINIDSLHKGTLQSINGTFQMCQKNFHCLLRGMIWQDVHYLEIRWWCIFVKLLIYTQVMIQFQVQFGINLHMWVFQKAEITWVANAIWALWKTLKYKFTVFSIEWEKRYDYFLIIILTWKKSCGGSAWRSCLKPFFLIRENFL